MEIGYGIQLKLGSTGIIRDNVIVRTKGPGIMVYGTRDRGRPSVVEANFLASSRTSSGIVVGGGPVIVRNNVSVDAAQAGIELENYGGRGLLHGVVVAYNTVYGGRRAGIRVPGVGPVEAQIVFNAAHALTGPALPSIRVGVQLKGNVDCRLLPCFVDPLVFDFRPIVGSALIGRPEGVAYAPTEDFFGTVRPGLPAIGAIERLSDGAIRLGRKHKP
jgi:hypothetical protein